jgi:hypothetical protein
MKLTPRFTRFTALTLAGVIAAGTLMSATPAHADKSKTLKYGAIGLGALGAYWLSKGKTLQGAAAVAGGLYAYKKGRDAQRKEHQDDWYSNYPTYGDGGYSGNGGYYGGYDRNDYGRGYGYSNYSNGGYYGQSGDNCDRYGNSRSNYDLRPYAR